LVSEFLIASPSFGLEHGQNDIYNTAYLKSKKKSICRQAVAEQLLPPPVPPVAAAFPKVPKETAVHLLKIRRT
jgi:hypothetical protein